MLITACMAAVSMTFALHMALKISLVYALPFALAWGMAILSLDRWLVVSLVRQQNKWSYLLLALPRLALAVLFGLIISTPFTLTIFQPEIDQAISQIQQQRADAYYKNLANDPLANRIKAEQAQVNNYEAIIKTNGLGSGLNPGTDPTVAALTQQLNQAQSQSDADGKQWQCQLYGPCKPTGNGPVAQAAHQRYMDDQAGISRLQGRISAQEAQIANGNKSGAASSLANAKKDLGPAKAGLAKDLANQASLVASFNNTNESNAGLLLRLQALSKAEGASGGLATARWVLFLFFTAIECLPVMVKVLLNLGPESTYEKAIAVDEKTSLRLAEQATANRYRAHILAREVMTEEHERVYTGWRQNKLSGIVDDTITAWDRLARERLDNWERDARSRNGGPPGNDPGPGSFSAP